MADKKGPKNSKGSKKLSKEARGRQIQHLRDLVERTTAFVELMKKESDRGCVLVGAAMLENTLGDLLSVVLRQDGSCQELLDPNMPLGNFASRTELTYALGLIDKEARDDLNLVRKMRNDAAHFKERGFEVGFDTALTRDWVQKLSHVQKHFRPLPAVWSFFKDVESGWKALFMTSTFTMLWYLDTAIMYRRENRAKGEVALTTPKTMEMVFQTEGLEEDLKRRPPVPK
jgi:DNA-binding MltR family transcriptional regulator